MKTKVLESYKKGFIHINELCKFETVRNFKDKTVFFKNVTFNIPCGCYHVDVGDDTLAKWLYINKLLTECNDIKEDDIYKLLLEVEEEIGEKDNTRGTYQSKLCK